MTFREKLRSLRDAAWALLMPIVVIGGILTGVFTVTESAAIAAIYAIFTGFSFTGALTASAKYTRFSGTPWFSFLQ